MSFWTAIVVIVAIIAVTEVIKSRHRSQSGITHGPRHGETQDGERDDRNDARREIEDLRERIKVLERIATEGNTPEAREAQRISAEIELLRDKQVD